MLQDAAVRMHVHTYICRLNAAEQARRGAAGAAPARVPGLTPGACRAGMLAGRAPVKTVSAHEPTLLALRRVLAAGVGGAAVVEGGAGGAVIANLSTSDLRCAARAGARCGGRGASRLGAARWRAVLRRSPRVARRTAVTPD